MSRIMYKTVAGAQERGAVLEPKIHDALKPLVEKSSDEPRFREMVNKMAEELTKWIDKEDGSPEARKVEASWPILNRYLAQLEGKTSEPILGPAGIGSNNNSGNDLILMVTNSQHYLLK